MIIKGHPDWTTLLTWVQTAWSHSPHDEEWGESKQQRDGQQDHQCSQFDVQGGDIGRVDLQRCRFPPSRQEKGGGGASAAADEHLSRLSQVSEDSNTRHHGFTQEIVRV